MPSGASYSSLPIAGQVIVVTAEVLCPSDTKGIDPEGSEVEVCVADVIVSGFDTGKKCVRVIPFTAEDGCADKAFEMVVKLPGI